ncbi:MAG: Nickel-dependent superoxide dismutase, partial [uncultured Nocardioides sp.]
VLPLHRPHRRRVGPLRPAVRGLRPGPGPHRGRVGQGDHRQGRRQRRPRLPHPRDPHQGAAFRAREAPPVGAVDRLLQAAALREVPAAAHPLQRGHQARGRRRRHEGRARRRRGRPAARQDRPDRRDLLGDQEGL